MDGMHAMTQAVDVSTRVRRVHSGFQRMLNNIEAGSESEDSSVAARRAVIEDATERYQLWAGNLGAFHTAADSRSLDHRLQNAKSVRKRVSELLDELLELQQSCESSPSVFQLAGTPSGEITLTKVTSRYAVRK